MATAPSDMFADITTDDIMADDARDLDGLIAFLRDESVRARDEFLDEERANAIDFYNGEPFGDEEDGRSQVVSRDVAEVVDYMTVSVLRTMASGDRVVEFDYDDENGRDIADEATAAVSRQFMQGQDGYRFLHDWIKAGLLEKASTAKVCVEEVPPRRREGEMPGEGLAMLQEQGARIVGVTPIDEAGENFRVAWLEPQPPVFRDYVSPNEETDIAQDARDLDHDCAYIGFRSAKTLSQLAKMGFDTDQLENLSEDGVANDTLSHSRDRSEGSFWQQGFQRAGANRKVWYHEEYAHYDFDGDGVAELLLVHRVGNQILMRDGDYAIQTVDEQPGVVWCPFPMQHRIVGQSLADKTMDIQRTRSVAMRQGLDNLYQSNSPRWALPESSIGDTTIDDLLTVRAGGVIRYVGAQGPTAVDLPFTADSALKFMEVLAGERESRTGITRLNQGLDADALNKTATGTALMQAQGQQIEEYIARNFAEAFARLMLKKYRLMRKFGRPMSIMVGGVAKQVDPRQWPEDMRVVVRVGLGSGRKEQRLQYRMMVLDLMARAASGGSRIVADKGVYNMVKGVIADANLGSVNDFLTDPATLDPEQDKPDPAMAKAQAAAMIEAEKVKIDQQKLQANTRSKTEQMQVDAALKQQQLDYDLQAKRERAALEAQLAEQRAEFEAAQAQQQADRQWQLSLMQLEQQRELAILQLRMKAGTVQHEAGEGEGDVEIVGVGEFGGVGELGGEPPTIRQFREGGDLDK